MSALQGTFIKLQRRGQTHPLPHFVLQTQTADLNSLCVPGEAGTNQPHLVGRAKQTAPHNSRKTVLPFAITVGPPDNSTCEGD